MSQNVTLSVTDWLDIGKIKKLILDGQNQTEMAECIGKRRETINRKIGRWMQTPDFDEWLGSLWLEHYGELHREDKKEAFRQLTKLFISKQTRRIEAKTESTIEIKQELSIKYDELNEDERNFCRAITRRYIKANNQERPAAIH